MRLLLSTDGSHASRGDAPPMVGLAVRLRTLRARGAAMPEYAPPGGAELLARVGLPTAAGRMMLNGEWL
jgi:hypothetical protein